ncbi:Cytochrome P450 3A31, partial [Sigmodon hispidus]
FGTQKHDVFKKQGIPGPKPLPFVGTLLNYYKGLWAFDNECCKKSQELALWPVEFSPHKLFDDQAPVFTITDTEMIKKGMLLMKECYSVHKPKFGIVGTRLEICLPLPPDCWK